MGEAKRRADAAWQQEHARANELQAQLDELREDLKRWDDEVAALLGPYTALRFTPARDYAMPSSAIPGFKSLLLSMTDTDRETLKRYMVLQIDDQEPWRYAVSEALFQKGLGPRDAVRIAQQVGALFYERLVKELGRKEESNGRAVDTVGG